MIIDVLRVGPYGTNCYIVGSEDTKQGIIIDPGDEVPRILSKVARLGLDIKMIVLTHGHIDHVGGLKDIIEATGAEMAIHSEDAGFLKGKSGKIFSMLTAGISYPTPPEPDRLLNDGDTIDVDGLHFEIIHTPGHTRGGICLLGDGVLFSGDTLFNSSVGRSDLPGGNHRQLIEAIRTRLLSLPDDTVVYPGHGSATTIGDERIGNPFLSNQSSL